MSGMRRGFRALLGALLLGGAALFAGRLLTEPREAGAGTLGRLLGYFLERELRIDVSFGDLVVLQVGDVVEANGRRIGELESILDDAGEVTPHLAAWSRRGRLKIHDASAAGLKSHASVRLVQVPQAAAWVVKTLFTAENVPKIAREWNDTMLVHREEIFALLTPIVRDFLIDLEDHVESEVAPFLARHREDVAALEKDLRAGAGGTELSRVLEGAVWPLAQPRLNPILARLSDEIWEKLPLWGLSWRIAYQALPGTDNDHFQRAWMQFLEREALPVLRSHTDEIVAVAGEVAREALAREDVHEAVREVFASVVAHPRFHSLAHAFLREVLLDNPEFHERLLRRARSPEVERAIAAASAHIEPMARRIGDIVLGTREAGITQEFARVLRSQILLKDRQRFVVDPGTPGSAPLADGAVLAAPVEVEHAR